jgi:hypothetical protein
LEWNTNNKCWQGCGKKEPSYNVIICKLVQPLRKTVWSLLKKLKLDLPYDPAIPLLGIYLKECKSGYSKDTCTSMFTAALFTTVKPWKQPKCPTSD